MASSKVDAVVAACSGGGGFKYLYDVQQPIKVIALAYCVLPYGASSWNVSEHCTYGASDVTSSAQHSIPPQSCAHSLSCKPSLLYIWYFWCVIQWLAAHMVLLVCHTALRQWLAAHMVLLVCHTASAQHSIPASIDVAQRCRHWPAAAAAAAADFSRQP
jgi:hypothetical protein